MTAAPIRIENAEDPRIAGYHAIRERDLVGREGLFVAEGKVVLNVLFSSGRFEPQSALVLESRLAGVEATLATAPHPMPVYTASQDVMDAIAGFHIHRGVLALGRRRDSETVEALLEKLPDDALVVVLVGISNHDNVGSIFRNAAAFSADAVILDATCCDPLYRKAIRVSVGAALKVPFAIGDSGEAIFDALSRHGYQQMALTPSGATDIGDWRRSGPTALYLGSEGDGLPASLMNRMSAVRIPIASGFDSLNVAAASAIALHRLWQVRTSA